MRNLGADIQRVTSKVGLFRDVADGPAQRTGPIERSLRSKQDLDALKVIELQVHIKRDFADIGRDRAPPIIIAITGSEAVSV